MGSIDRLTGNDNLSPRGTLVTVHGIERPETAERTKDLLEQIQAYTPFVYGHTA